MDFFSRLMEKSINIKKSDIKFYEVSYDKIPEIPDGEYKEVKIESCIDVKVDFNASKIKLSVFLEDVNYMEYLDIKYLNDSEKLIIQVLAKKEIEHGYIKVILPELEKFEVVSKYSDLKINRAYADEISISTNSGDVVASIDMTRYAKIVSDSGDILLKTKNKMFKIDATSKNGDVIWNNIKSNRKSNDEIKIFSKNGDVQVKLMSE